MLTIWKYLIQSKIDYCSQLGAPTDQASISRLESVACNFTSQISGMEHKDYLERLHDIHLYSQERHREQYKLILLWKIVHTWDAMGGSKGVGGGGKIALQGDEWIPHGLSLDMVYWELKTRKTIQFMLIHTIGQFAQIWAKNVDPVPSNIRGRKGCETFWVCILSLMNRVLSTT